ncbi:hypothetical protein [Acrocarpospora catenulata]|uniref:hypothetical protein n=1 Tax=Acrocarpospora catenulata TaxID=2836182 RepID=UPI001BDA686F|nr:hypothetical protein [Acrocarpospora catenulata]
MSGVAAIGSDEHALRELETLVVQRGMTTAYFPGPDGAGAALPNLMVFDTGGAERARVTIAPRARTFMVSLFKTESPRLLPVRNATDAAGMICGHQDSPTNPGATPDG